MRTVIPALLLFIICFAGHAQVPVMNPIAGSSVACSAPGGPTGFTASASNAPTQYSWSVSPSAGVQFSSYSGPTVSVTFPQGTMTYTIYCYASNGSGAGAPVAKVINVYETPTVTFSGGNAAFCQGSSTILMGSSTTQAASSTLSYLWSPLSGLSSSNTYSSIASPTVSTTYTVTVNLGFCSNVYFLPITVLPVPVLNVSSSQNPICQGDTATITLSGNSALYMLNSNFTPASFMVSPPVTTNYVFTGVGQNGCTTQQTFVQNVIPSANFALYATPNPMCAGQTSTITLTGSPSAYSVNAASSANSFTLSPAVTSTYVIRGVNANGCKKEMIHVQHVLPIPSVNVSSSSNPMCAKETHTITLAGNGASYFVNNLPSAGVFTVSPAKTATYVVKAVGQNGCESEISFVQQVSPCAGTEDLLQSKENLRVYPNPSSGQVYLSAPAGSKVLVFDQLGRGVISLQPLNGEVLVLDGLSPGVYLVVAGSESLRLVILK